MEYLVYFSAAASVSAILGFIYSRMKDAEARGALIQRVSDLEKRQEKHDDKMDKILEKLDNLSSDLRGFFDSHVQAYHKP